VRCERAQTLALLPFCNTRAAMFGAAFRSGPPVHRFHGLQEAEACRRWPAHGGDMVGMEDWMAKRRGTRRQRIGTNTAGGEGGQ
jgi:hypothetical protein